MNEQEHWLVRASTIRRLWIGSGVVLGLLVLLELVLPTEGRFGVDDWPAFGAVFGFLSCLAMVVMAKGLGVLLKRPDSYYQDDERDE